MAEILFNNNVDIYGFNIGTDNISYPSDKTQIEEATTNSIVYSFVNNDMYQDNRLYGIYKSEALTRDKYIIYRQSISSNTKTYLATIEGVVDGFWDYNIGQGEKYKYIVETVPSNKSDSLNANSISLETSYFVNPNWSHWSICDIEKSLDFSESSGCDVYIPSDTVFLLKCNVAPGSINDNLKIIKYDTLSQYGRVIQNQQKYDSGNISCLIGDIEAVESIDNSQKIIIINEVYNKEDFNNIFEKKIIDLHIVNYDEYDFLFPNYSSKHYECKKDIVYQILQSTTEPEEWDTTFGLYYTKNSDGEYVKTEMEYVLVDEIIGQEKLNGPVDFNINYSQYYIKIEDKYVKLTEPSPWSCDTYYTLTSPDYEPNKYYQQIIDYKMVEKPTKTKYKILNSIDTLNSWRECVSNGKLKILKAPNGSKWIVSISDQNSIDVDWRSPDYPSTINFNWQEVLDKNKISIIKW